MSEKEAAVLAFFVVLPSGTKWNQSENKKNIDKFIEIPLTYEKYHITSYGIFKKRWQLKTIQKYAKKNKLKIYEAFSYLLNLDAEQYGYFIEHFHVLHKTHKLPKNKIPKNWRGVRNEPYNTIINKIIQENTGIQKYQKQYDLTIKLLGILPEHLTLIKLRKKQFVFTTKLLIISIGKKGKLKKIFKNHNEKPKISSLLGQKKNYDSKLTKKQKRKIIKKNHRIDNTMFVNKFIKEANQKFSLKNVNVHHHEAFLFLAKYAQDKWDISWNDFIECKQFNCNNKFQHLNHRKTASEVEQMFLDQKARTG